MHKLYAISVGGWDESVLGWQALCDILKIFWWSQYLIWLEFEREWNWLTEQICNLPLRHRISGVEWNSRWSKLCRENGEMRFRRAGESMNAREENREGNTEQWCGVCQKRKYIHLVSSLHTVGGPCTNCGGQRITWVNSVCMIASASKRLRISGSSWAAQLRP